MKFVFGEDNSIPNYFYEIPDEYANGIILADPTIEDLPIMYADAAFEKLNRYSQEEIIRRNCRFLQVTDTAQPAGIDDYQGSYRAKKNG